MAPWILALVLMVTSISPAIAEDDSEEAGEEDVACTKLGEQMEIILPLAQNVREEFAKLTDPALCPAMSEQCSYFEREVKHLQKSYRQKCDDDYKVKNVACDYGDSVCPRPRQVATREF